MDFCRNVSLRLPSHTHKKLIIYVKEFEASNVVWASEDIYFPCILRYNKNWMIRKVIDLMTSVDLKVKLVETTIIEYCLQLKAVVSTSKLYVLINHRLCW